LQELLVGSSLIQPIHVEADRENCDVPITHVTQTGGVERRVSDDHGDLWSEELEFSPTVAKRGGTSGIDRLERYGRSDVVEGQDDRVFTVVKSFEDVRIADAGVEDDDPACDMRRLEAAEWEDVANTERRMPSENLPGH
jgi:hypothetical protein